MTNNQELKIAYIGRKALFNGRKVTRAAAEKFSKEYAKSLTDESQSGAKYVACVIDGKQCWYAGASLASA